MVSTRWPSLTRRVLWRNPGPESVNAASVRGLVVMIVACQVMDPGSIPGERNFYFLFDSATKK